MRLGHQGWAPGRSANKLLMACKVRVSMQLLYNNIGCIRVVWGFGRRRSSYAIRSLFMAAVVACGSGGGVRRSCFKPRVPRSRCVLRPLRYRVLTPVARFHTRCSQQPAISKLVGVPRRNARGPGVGGGSCACRCEEGPAMMSSVNLVSSLGDSHGVCACSAGGQTLRAGGRHTQF